MVTTTFAILSLLRSYERTTVSSRLSSKMPNCERYAMDLMPHSIIGHKSTLTSTPTCRSSAFYMRAYQLPVTHGYTPCWLQCRTNVRSNFIFEARFDDNWTGISKWPWRSLYSLTKRSFKTITNAKSSEIASSSSMAALPFFYAVS